MVYAPSSAARSGNCCSKMISKVAIAAEATKGVPPKVEACAPAVNASRSFALPSIAPIGRPLAIPLARVKISGSMP
ncbi:hypothetical protein D3C71_2146870 [compost metagenome]